MTAARPKRRVFMWFFLALQALFLLWLVWGVSKSASNGGCISTDTACSTAAQVGTGLGFVMVLALWMVVDVILGVIFLVTRRR